jgi:hypothetical protein
MTNKIEPRRSVRIQVPFPAVVEGIDANGEDFKVDTVLDNLSKEGLYLRVFKAITTGDMLNITFKLAPDYEQNPDPSEVAVRGKVLRVEVVSGGACGIAVQFEPARFK